MKSYNPKKVRERLRVNDSDFLTYLLTKNGFVKIRNQNLIEIKQLSR